jgi:hypothetical protein
MDRDKDIIMFQIVYIDQNLIEYIKSKGKVLTVANEYVMKG